MSPDAAAIRVAFLVDQGATVIDFTGPWEAFQDAEPPGHPGFVLYTVAPRTEPVRVSGAGLHPGPDGAVVAELGGFTIVPDFWFEDAPQPDIIVMGAQSNHSEEKLAWIRQAAAEAEVVLSVCTGAFLLARTGLLDGLRATTHHDFFDEFESKFPAIRLARGPRFVDNGNLVTAGGLTSGVDGALHVIGRYFGPDVARQTAALMEYTPATELGGAS